MGIPMNATCYLCQVAKHVEKTRALGGEEQATAFIRDLMTLFLQGPADMNSARFAVDVDRLYRVHYGLKGDRYVQEKKDSNRFALERLAEICRRVEAAEDPVYAGLQFAILGNYLDFAALHGQVSYEVLSGMLDKAQDIQVDQNTYRKLTEDLKISKKLLYLTDNAGEIVFDRIFAEEISKAFPELQITFCVRGGPVHNDATREDAQAVGISFPVIDNGNNVGGTELALLSPEAKQAMEQADVIIAKGMGNTETLLGCGYNIYYAFLVKCDRFVEHFSKPKMTPMLVREKP